MQLYELFGETVKHAVDFTEKTVEKRAADHTVLKHKIEGLEIKPAKKEFIGNKLNLAGRLHHYSSGT